MRQNSLNISDGASQLSGSLVSGMDLFAKLPNPKLVSSYTTYITTAAGQNFPLYTVPAGRRAIFYGAAVAMATGPGGGCAFNPMVEIGGVFYQLSGTNGGNTFVNPGAGAGVSGTATAMYIAEAGESFVLQSGTDITATQSGFFTATIIEFDNTSALRSVKALGFTGTAPVTLYTPAAGKNGLLVGNFPLLGIATAYCWGIFNNAVATCYFSYCRAGASATVNNRITAAITTSVNQGAVGALSMITIANGDSLVFVPGAALTSGPIIPWLWTNVLEF